ncbi:MAG: DNA-binding MarR family transcriptional regulator [bacterium]|jgi:DNA-binding MarR family transcriptional regulator
MTTKARFDETIHAPKRLQICAFLMPLQDAEFQVLRDELDVSDSVLSKHLKHLDTAGYVKFRRGALNGRQRMWASMTENGRRAFLGHAEELRRIIADQSY